MALFSIAIAALAVLQVARGDSGVHIHTLVAAALGTGLSVLLAGALMSLAFLSNSGGRDGHSAQFEKDEQP